MNGLKGLTYILLLFVIGTTPLDALEVLPGVTAGRIFFVLMAGSALFSNDVFIKSPPLYMRMLMVFMGWCVLTILWSFSPRITITRILYLIQYLFIIAVAHNVVNTPKRLKWMLASWIIGATFIAAKTSIDYATNAFSVTSLYRVNEYGNPNENSFMLCYAFLFLCIIDNTKRKIPTLIFSVLCLYTAVSNGSRMGIILFSISYMSYLIVLFQNKKFSYLIVLIPLIAIGSMYVLNHYFSQASLDRIFSITSNIQNRQLAHRDEIWSTAIGALSGNWCYSITGSGWGTFQYAIKNYMGREIGAHNFYLDVLFTTGVIGFIIIVKYLFCLFQLIRNMIDRNILTYALLFIPMISMMSTNWQSRRWWFIMGVIIYKMYEFNNLKDAAEV